MISVDEELRSLRAKIDLLTRTLDALEQADVAGGMSFSAKTTAVGTYPTSASGTMFAMIATDITGAETEGGMATVSPRDGVFLAVCLGSTVPPINTEVIVKVVPNAFVFEYGN